MAAARETSGERVVEIEGEMTREIFDDLHLKPGEVKCVFMGNDGPAPTHQPLPSPLLVRMHPIRRRLFHIHDRQRGRPFRAQSVAASLGARSAESWAMP